MDSNHTCLAVISLDSALVSLSLLECKYIEQKVVRHTTVDFGDLESSSDDFDEE